MNTPFRVMFGSSLTGNDGGIVGTFAEAACRLRENSGRCKMFSKPAAERISMPGDADACAPNHEGRLIVDISTEATAITVASPTRPIHAANPTIRNRVVGRSPAS